MVQYIHKRPEKASVYETETMTIISYLKAEIKIGAVTATSNTKTAMQNSKKPG